MESCRNLLKIQDHTLHVITVNDNTVLHMATRAKEAASVEKLLDELPTIISTS